MNLIYFIILKGISYENFILYYTKSDWYLNHNIIAKIEYQ